ncbi:DUF777 family protein, partial [Borrelia persica]|uniref:DUF777 family protein n=1 Tax=Borrelia persica TaxID=44448 RepID=UPI0004659E86
LNAEDKVILLQSSISLFDSKDNNYFDKNYFYILRPIDMQKCTIKVNDFSIDTVNPIEIKNTQTSLKQVLDQLISCLNNLR